MIQLTDADVFIAIDIQNDFCPGGALAVDRGDEVVPVANRMGEKFFHVIQTQDWHTPDHSSFASAHEGKEPFETMQADYGEQVLWPDHCVQGTNGAAFHPAIKLTRSQLIVRKGYRSAIDSYSAFFENDGKTPTGLHGYLQERGLNRLFFAGLATDFCVQWSALDARKLGYETYVLIDGCRGIDIDGSVDAALQAMEEAGVRIVQSEEIQ